MSKLVQKSGFFKPRGAGAATAYMKYIATREGVEKVVSHNADHPGTEKQRQLINSILRDYPDARELFEYEDFLSRPCMGNASEFISMALDSNWDAAGSSDIYMKYIATRLHVEKRGGHGLFSDRDDVDLNKAIAEISSYDGNIWTFILSLRREDAARLEYDNAAAWQTLVKEHRGVIADALRIPPDDFCWYAAFHNESHHPHIHMMAYSLNPSAGYLDTAGIRKMRSALTNGIFKEEMNHLYEQKSASRDELVSSARSAMAELINQMQSGICDNPEIARRMSELAEQLKNESGKMQYGYLKPHLKNTVNDIVDELEHIPAVSNCYEKWRELQGSVQSYYTGEAPERLPLSQQKEFKAIKNAVIREALSIASGAVTFEDEDADEPEALPDISQSEAPLPTEAAEPAFIIPNTRSGKVYVNWTGDYKAALKYLYGTDDAEPSIDDAFALMTAEAECGNALAMHALAKMHRDGVGTIPDDEKAAEHFSLSFSSFVALERKSRDDKLQYRIGKMLLTGTGTIKDVDKATDYFERSAKAGNKFAQYQLAKLYLAEEAPDTQKVQQAIRWLKDSAENENEYAQYALGKLYLLGEIVPKDVPQAVGYLTASAEQGNQYAQYALGKLYLLGRDIPRDKETALRLLELSAAQGNIYAQFFIDRADDHSGPSALLSTTRLLYHMGNIFRDNSSPPQNPNGIRIDSKRRRKLRQMKIASGHAEDEHDSEYTQIMSY